MRSLDPLDADRLPASSPAAGRLLPAWLKALVLLATLMLLLALLIASELAADDLRASDRFLCAAREVHACDWEGCGKVDPAEIGVPDFLEIDLVARELRTTAASGEDRRTPVVHLDRAGGRITLQGIENGRAWSFTLDEATGELVAAVAREGRVVAAFGVCTPQPAQP